MPARNTPIVTHNVMTCPSRVEAAMATAVRTRMAIATPPSPSGRAYSAWPERIYIIDPSGKIVYKGGNGPTDFYPEEARQFLEKAYRTDVN